MRFSCPSYRCAMHSEIWSQATTFVLLFSRYCGDRHEDFSIRLDANARSCTCDLQLSINYQWCVIALSARCVRGWLLEGLTMLETGGGFTDVAWPKGPGSEPGHVVGTLVEDLRTFDERGEPLIRATRNHTTSGRLNSKNVKVVVISFYMCIVERVSVRIILINTVQVDNHVPINKEALD
jgi:hypothetical protein